MSSRGRYGRRSVEEKSRTYFRKGREEGRGFYWNFVYFISNVKKRSGEGGCVVEGKGGREKQAAAGKKRRFELFCVDYDCKLRSEELQVRYCTD